MSWYQFRPYVSVAERRRKAMRETSKLVKKGQPIRPIELTGRTIARTFWGKAWCDNLEQYSDFASRLPRGRSYVRNGSVVHLDVRAGEVEALVAGSELYKVKITLKAAVKPKWHALCRECSGGISSMIELLQGRFSDNVMGVLTRKGTGLFPSPQEIEMKCSCPDWATMCKHVAAVLYGIGARLDQSPELLFLLRSVKHEELISQAAGAGDLAAKANTGPELLESELGSVFGIELDETPMAQRQTVAPIKTRSATKPSTAGKKRKSKATKSAKPIPQRR